VPWPINLPLPLTPQDVNACEYSLSGRNGKFQCCPHGITKPQMPPYNCCIDNLDETPYR